MIEPWEPSFQAIVADENPYDTFAGVGRVLTEWECIESGLCRIFSYLVGDPDGDALRAYGEPRIFSQRFDSLLRAANRFFVSNPDQHLEATMHQMSARILAHSDRRNEIAHGVVTPINSYSFAKQIIPEPRPNKKFWALIPPYYLGRKHTPEGLPSFIYGSTRLNHIADDMSNIYPELVVYRSAVSSLVFWKGQRSPSNEK